MTDVNKLTDCRLKTGERISSPEAVMAYSSEAENAGDESYAGFPGDRIQREYRISGRLQFPSVCSQGALNKKTSGSDKK